ncbi:hypothetical protein THRCLA_21182 [Thraustotheca clavata]|uniref:Uncharacterized protein n=1 Tax=Thraustotheca clavata TaxID=74557 RepID=A0A1V9ZZC8_9STRA|nr:hypothetical protein THRCLA_21182 [Thraustotheca clavata]
MAKARRKKQTRQPKIVSYQLNLQLQADVAAAVSQIRLEASHQTQRESVRIPLRLHPRSIVSTPPISLPAPKDHIPDISLLFAKTHYIHLANPTLADLCLHEIAKVFDCLDDTCEDTKHSLQLLSIDQLSRLSILVTWYRRWTSADQLSLLCNPSLEELCISSLSIPDTLPHIIPVSTTAISLEKEVAESWEEASEIEVHSTGCARLLKLELVACRNISSNLLRALPALEMFTLMGNSDFDNVDNDLLLHLPLKLRVLWLIGCPWFTNDKILSFAQQRHSTLGRVHLCEVRIVECHHISCTMIETLWHQYLPNVLLRFN